MTAGRSSHTFERCNSASAPRRPTFLRTNCANWRAKSNEPLAQRLSIDGDPRACTLRDRFCILAAAILPVLPVRLSFLAEHRIGLPAAADDVSPGGWCVGIQHPSIIGIRHSN